MSTEVDLIKERLDLAQVIGEYVSLRRAGQHFKALCPFHQEKTPSFVVSPGKGVWHCFGCGESGDVFAFIQKKEGLDFPATLRLLAERAGVTLSKQSPKSQQRRQRLFEVLALASRFYEEVLRQPGSGSKVQDYLRQRGLKPETMKLFQIGYAPPQWDILQKYLRHKGFTIDEMLATGVVGKNDSGRLFDRFRGRIMFPIADLQGRMVAFGGRITPWAATGKEGKYINSPETELYSKRRTIYNLHRAKHTLRQQQACLVVEGYMDVVLVTQGGVPCVVASSGTAFTNEQIDQLRRFTAVLHFAFDADAAGWKAAQAATKAALSAGLRVATVPLPPGKDPADVALEIPDQLSTILSTTQSLTSLLLERLRASSQTPGEDRDTRFQELLPFLQSAHNPIQQGEMIREVAESLHVPESKIMQMVEQYRPDVAPARELATEPVMVQASSAMHPERHLLGLLMLDGLIRQELFSQLQPAIFVDTPMQQLYTVMQSLAAHRDDFFTMSSDDFLRHLPGEYLPLAESICALAQEQRSLSNHTPKQEATLLWRVLQRRQLEQQLRSMQQELAGVSEDGASEDHRQTVLRQFQALAEQLEQIKAQP